MKFVLSENIFFLALLISISVAGCKGNKMDAKKKARLETVKSSKNEIVEKSISSFNCDSTVVNDEFSNKVLAFEVFKADTDKVKSLFLEPVFLKIEKIDEKQGDYFLHNFSDGINKIILYRNPTEGFYIEEADIKNDKVRLNKKIAIGMKEDIFLGLIKATNFRCDTITVKDDELTFESVYVFKDAKLREIIMGQILE